MIKYNFIPQMGQHYVFFLSLYNEPYTPPEEGKIDYAKAFRESGNPQIRDIAESYFNSYIGDSQEKESESNFYALMQVYINMLNQLAQNERAAETAYIKEMYKKFDALRNKSENEISKQDREIAQRFCNRFESYVNDDNWDYPNIIGAFNTMVSDYDRRIKSIQQLHNFLQEQESNTALAGVEKFRTVEIKKKKNKNEKAEKVPIDGTLKDWFLTNYSTYRSAFYDAGGQAFRDTYTTEFAEYIQTTIARITKDPETLTGISAALKEASITDPKRMADIVRNKVAWAASKKLPYEELKNFLIDKNKITNNLRVPDVASIFTIKDKDRLASSVEEYALLYNYGIAEQFLDAWLSDDSATLTTLGNIQKQLLQNFKIDPNNTSDKTYKLIQTLIQKIQQISDTTDKDAQSKAKASAAGLKAQLTKILRANIRKNAEEQVKTFQKYVLEKTEKNEKLWEQERKRMLEEILQASGISDPVKFQDSLYKNLTVTAIDVPSAAEIISNVGIQLIPMIGDYVKHSSYSPGKPINSKTDITFSVTFKPFGLTNSRWPMIQKGIEASKPLEQKLMRFSEDVITQYKSYITKNNKGSADIDAAYDIYMKNIKELRELFDTASRSVGNDKTIVKGFKDDISTTFLGGISVKQYMAYHTELGFHGGALGADNLASAGINEIEKLYDKVGLNDSGIFTPEDKNFIIDAAMNCNTGFVHEDVIEAIKDFLVGGALMMMFEDGFANTQKVLDTVKAQFGGVAPKTVHLYQFDTLFVPASYLLTNICEHLQAYENDIQQMTQTTSQAATIEFVSTISNSDIPVPTGEKTEENKKYYSAQNRWAAVRDKALNSTKMYILLMAGLLDLFKMLPQYLQSPMS